MKRSIALINPYSTKYQKLIFKILGGKFNENYFNRNRKYHLYLTLQLNDNIQATQPVQNSDPVPVWDRFIHFNFPPDYRNNVVILKCLSKNYDGGKDDLIAEGKIELEDILDQHMSHGTFNLFRGAEQIGEVEVIWSIQASKDNRPVKGLPSEGRLILKPIAANFDLRRKNKVPIKPYLVLRISEMIQRTKTDFIGDKNATFVDSFCFNVNEDDFSLRIEAYDAGVDGEGEILADGEFSIYQFTGLRKGKNVVYLDKEGREVANVALEWEFMPVSDYYKPIEPIAQQIPYHSKLVLTPLEARFPNVKGIQKVKFYVAAKVGQQKKTTSLHHSPVWEDELVFGIGLEEQFIELEFCYVSITGYGKELIHLVGYRKIAMEKFLNNKKLLRVKMRDRETEAEVGQLVLGWEMMDINKVRNESAIQGIKGYDFN